MPELYAMMIAMFIPGLPLAIVLLLWLRDKAHFGGKIARLEITIRELEFEKDRLERRA